MVPGILDLKGFGKGWVFMIFCQPLAGANGTAPKMTTSIVPEHTFPLARLSQALLAISVFAQIAPEY